MSLRRGMEAVVTYPGAAFWLQQASKLYGRVGGFGFQDTALQAVDYCCLHNLAGHCGLLPSQLQCSVKDPFFGVAERDCLVMQRIHACRQHRLILTPCCTDSHFAQHNTCEQASAQATSGELGGHAAPLPLACAILNVPATSITGAQGSQHDANTSFS